MPRTASRLRKARIRQEGVQVVKDSDAAIRSERSKQSRGHDERGRYGKSVNDPDTEDKYHDKD
jgi:hypothetical protein